ncbi:MAG: hypothetical protein H8E87_04320 [FCB group bacterium]|nr:hypothetical protein [FCB group bacterium]
MAADGQIAFNPGEWSTGTTSLLWDVILAAGFIIGIPIVWYSILIGAILYLILGQLVFAVFRDYWDDFSTAFFAALIVVITGNVIWFALSGMETILFLTLGLLWIEVFRRRKIVLTGLISGLLMLTRIEGLLFILIGIFFTLYRDGIKKGLKKSIIIVLCALPFILPSILLNLKVAGEFYPTTMAGKKWLYYIDSGFFAISIDRIWRFIAVWFVTLFETNWFPETLSGSFTFKYYFFRLIYGGSLDRQPLNLPMNSLPVILQIVLLLAGIILILILLVGVWKSFKYLIKDLLQKKKELSGWHYFIFWFLGHNLIYLSIMPIRGHGGRYQAVNFIAFGLFLTAGLDSVKFIWKRRHILKQKILKFLILTIYILSLITWGSIYAESVRHVNEVHCKAGKWIRDNLPPDAVLAVFDVGAVKFFSEMKILDIAGLTDQEALKYVLKGDIVPYMKTHHADYLIFVEELLTPREIAEGKTEYLNSVYYERLGIKRERGRTLDLEPVIKFSISRNEWYRHWKALLTHSPILAVYKIHWLSK